MLEFSQDLTCLPRDLSATSREQPVSQSVDKGLVGWIWFLVVYQQAGQRVHVVGQPCRLTRCRRTNTHNQGLNKGIGSKVGQQRRESIGVLNRIGLTNDADETTHQSIVSINHHALKQFKGPVSIGWSLERIK